MAGITLTVEMAQGAAWLHSQGRAAECWIAVPGRTRYCHLMGASADGAVVTLRTFAGVEARYADVPTGRVQVAEVTGQRLLLACAESQRRASETAEQRQGREAAQSTALINARLWAAQQARRNRRGQFAGHSCEPAGRR